MNDATVNNVLKTRWKEEVMAHLKTLQTTGRVEWCDGEQWIENEVKGRGRGPICDTILVSALTGPLYSEVWVPVISHLRSAITDQFKTHQTTPRTSCSHLINTAYLWRQILKQPRNNVQKTSVRDARNKTRPLHLTVMLMYLQSGVLDTGS